MKLINLSHAKRSREPLTRTSKRAEKAAPEPSHLYHEIANQLSVIGLSSFLLRKSLQETLSQEQRERILTIERTTEMLREIINGLPRLAVVSRPVSDNLS